MDLKLYDGSLIVNGKEIKIYKNELESLEKKCRNDISTFFIDSKKNSIWKCCFTNAIWGYKKKKF